MKLRIALILAVLAGSIGTQAQSTPVGNAIQEWCDRKRKDNRPLASGDRKM